MPVNNELENLVLDYCKAAANLYYCISVKKLLEIYNSQNEPLTQTEFCDILEKIFTENQFFGLFSEEEISTGKPDKKTIIEKELLSEHLYCLDNFDDYFELKEVTLGMPYHILAKDKFLKYADDLYVEKTLEFISLRAYFRNIPDLTREDADDLALETVDTLRLFDRDPEYILARMDELNIGPKNQGEFDRFMDLCYDVSRKIRLATLRGATLEEIHGS